MYEIWLTDDHGLRLALLDDILWLSASRVDGGIGQFTGGFKKDLNTNLIHPDFQVQVWRSPPGGRLFLWRPYFIRRWRFETVGGAEHLLLEGPCVNDLLRRRIVAAYADSAQASKTAAADDMMKAIVTESLADGVAPVPAAGTRVWANLTVAPNFSLGPALTKAFAYKQLLTLDSGGILPAIAEASRKAGIEVFYNIVPHVVSSNHISYQFRTYIGQPGMNVSNRVVFDQEQGNLKDVFLEFDYSQEQNYIYGGGQGEAAQRTIQQAYDATRYGASQWARCEGFADARDQTSTTGVLDAARDMLEKGRPSRRLGGTPVDTEATRFGRDWDWGYKVRARYRGQEFDSIIRVVAIGLDSAGVESIQARLEYEAWD